MRKGESNLECVITNYTFPIVNLRSADASNAFPRPPLFLREKDCTMKIITDKLYAGMLAYIARNKAVRFYRRSIGQEKINICRFNVKRFAAGNFTLRFSRRS